MARLYCSISFVEYLFANVGTSLTVKGENLAVSPEDAAEAVLLTLMVHVLVDGAVLVDQALVDGPQLRIFCFKARTSVVVFYDVSDELQVVWLNV